MACRNSWRLWANTGFLVPVIGGLIAGPIITYFAKEAKGHGVPEVKTAIITQGGRIRPRGAVVKSVASAVCIGTGGSAGREGPIVQVGADNNIHERVAAGYYGVVVILTRQGTAPLVRRALTAS